MVAVVPATAGQAPPSTVAQRKSRTGYLLLFPGMAWLGVFFAIPLVTLLATSLQSPIEGRTGKYKPGLEFSNYVEAFADYWPQFLRSFLYAGTATLLALRDRLSAGVLHRVPGRAVAVADAGAGHRAVVRVVPAAHATRGRRSSPTRASSRAP